MAQSHLERCAHETIAVAALCQEQKVDLKHEHVDCNGQGDQEQCAGDKVVDPGAWRDTQVAQEIPELLDSRASNGGNDEQSNPLATTSQAQASSSKTQPNEPFVREGVAALIVKVGPGKGCESGEQDQWRIQEDQSTLCCNAVFYSSKSVSQLVALRTTIKKKKNSKISSEIVPKRTRSAASTEAW